MSGEKGGFRCWGRVCSRGNLQEMHVTLDGHETFEFLARRWKAVGVYFRSVPYCKPGQNMPSYTLGFTRAVEVRSRCSRC